MLHWNLLAGPLPIALLVLAFAAGVYLVARRDFRRWWAVVIPSVAVGATLGALVIDWFVTDVWKPFPDPLPGLVVVWIGAILAAVGLLVVTLVKASWRRRVIAVVAAVVIIATSLNQINRAYGYYPTLATALGQSPERQIPLPPVQAGGDVGATVGPQVPGPDPGGSGSDPGPAGHGSDPGAGSGASRHGLAGWRPRGAVPTLGAVSKVTIPGTLSGFHARTAWVYLPPAYLVRPRPSLPVLMLIAGQPGSPSDWINGGRVAATMDEFAARHHGLAPIVIMPDATGSTTGNTMCVNSRSGNADTYLSRDVVDWIEAHLQVDRDTAHWAVGGFSFGGTCALQMAVYHPRLFPTFLDISGQVAPTLGSNGRTVAVAFGGNAAAYTRIQPLHILSHSRHDPVWRLLRGIFAVGAHDRRYGGEQATVLRACRAAGITVSSFTEPGDHSWYVAAAAMPHALPTLALRMGLL